MCVLRIKKKQGISGISPLGAKKRKNNTDRERKLEGKFHGVLGKNEQVIVLDSSISLRGQT